MLRRQSGDHSVRVFVFELSFGDLRRRGFQQLSRWRECTLERGALHFCGLLRLELRHRRIGENARRAQARQIWHHVDQRERWRRAEEHMVLGENKRTAAGPGMRIRMVSFWFT